ncbi:hypothetical protein ACFL0X_02260 [Nanoarchaeota archaeon]
MRIKFPKHTGTALVGWGVGLLLGAILHLYSPDTIPRARQVQQGYIAPNSLEIECEDLDGNGELETIMRIDDKPYLLRKVDGKPVLSPYRIRPAEIVPEE